MQAKGAVLFVVYNLRIHDFETPITSNHPCASCRRIYRRRTSQKLDDLFLKLDHVAQQTSAVQMSRTSVTAEGKECNLFSAFMLTLPLPFCTCGCTTKLDKGMFCRAVWCKLSTSKMSLGPIASLDRSIARRTYHSILCGLKKSTLR